jgi:hypothetical protein
MKVAQLGGLPSALHPVSICAYTSTLNELTKGVVVVVVANSAR